MWIFLINQKRLCWYYFEADWYLRPTLRQKYKTIDSNLPINDNSCSIFSFERKLAFNNIQFLCFKSQDTLWIVLHVCREISYKKILLSLLFTKKKRFSDSLRVSKLISKFFVQENLCCKDALDVDDQQDF